MAGSIGSYSFLVWKGYLIKSHRRVALLPPDVGVDGVSVIRSGWTSEPSEIITTVEAADLTAANALDEAYRVLEGTAVTAVDSLGRSSSVIVMRVDGEPSYTSLGVARLIARWSLLVQTVPLP